jgi:hypothetical protein
MKWSMSDVGCHITDISSAFVECLLLLRVSDAGRSQRCGLHCGRRPKAAKERTRGGWGAENAAHSAMGIWLIRKVWARERRVLGGGWLRGWQAAIARVDD